MVESYPGKRWKDGNFSWLNKVEWFITSYFQFLAPPLYEKMDFVAPNQKLNLKCSQGRVCLTVRIMYGKKVLRIDLWDYQIRVHAQETWWSVFWVCFLSICAQREWVEWLYFSSIGNGSVRLDINEIHVSKKLTWCLRHMGSMNDLRLFVNLQVEKNKTG